jgi:hypothetical protein
MKNSVYWDIKTKFVLDSKHVTFPSRLMLCKIRGFDSGDFKEYRPLGCDAVVTRATRRHFPEVDVFHFNLFSVMNEM